MNNNLEHTDELTLEKSNLESKSNSDLASSQAFNEHDIIHKLQHYLPAQNPLKDFVHHNSLHSFQEFPFHTAIQKGSNIFGYKGYLELKDYRDLYKKGEINDAAINFAIQSNFGKNKVEEWKNKMLNHPYNENIQQKVGQLRNQWKTKLFINLDKEVFPPLLRLISNYFDQGVSIWSFPITNKGFLDTIKHIEKNTHESLFRTEKVRELLFAPGLSITKLLKLVVGKEEYFEHYLFDQQFSHPGWSGMVAVVEQNPSLLYDRRNITLNEFIILELLLELDSLYNKHNDTWSPLGYKAELTDANLFSELEKDDLFEVYKLWLESYEWTYYHEVISGLSHSSKKENLPTAITDTTFQAFFCIDDREMSFRQHIELVDNRCETFGTPGHFGVVAYYKPDKGHFLTKVCPAPLQPKHVLKETYKDKKIDRDTHFNSKAQSIFWGWLLTQTLGFLSGFNLFKMLISPKHSAGTNYSFDHMHKESSLQIDYDASQKEGEYRVGFTLDEMVGIIVSILKTTGLINDFSPLVYFIGHGASSTNNPYYAGYGCGACVGRPGSANARAAAEMANRPEVRRKLKEQGVNIPENTWFVGGLHDTTRDEVAFYDEKLIPNNLQANHQKNVTTIDQALVNNAKERARRFDNIPLKLNKLKNFKQVKDRSIKLFEIRPEYNHATNTLFIVGRREITKKLFLDRRAFLNSYDYRQDSSGDLLATILNAGAGVCAGINLEYYFSRVDTHRLGAGSKLPQNIIGLIGVANGVEGDLRPGLPYQMVEIHDPLRLMTVIEQKPDVVLKVLNNNAGIKEWYFNQWMNLMILDPETKQFFQYKDNQFLPFEWKIQETKTIENIEPLFTSSRENLPVLLIK